MKHIFIVNPAAGAKDSSEEIHNALKKLHQPIDYELYTTKFSGDATEYIKNRLSSTKETLRFYACGGDGTLNEVVNGVIGFENAEVAAFPCGSGNDYIKYYGSAADFSDLSELLNGALTKVDVLKVGNKYAINAVHFGLDSFVLKTMLKVRRVPVLGGKNAYTTGVLAAFVGGMKTLCRLIADGKEIGKEKLLLCTLSNGKYVGGSYKCAPKSLNDDGFMELCHVKPVSRLTFLKLINIYKRGEHLDNPKFEKFLNYTRAKRVELHSEKGIYISIDGELEFITDCTVEVVPLEVNFVLPKALAKNKELQAANQL